MATAADNSDLGGYSSEQLGDMIKKLATRRNDSFVDSERQELAEIINEIRDELNSRKW